MFFNKVNKFLTCERNNIGTQRQKRNDNPTAEPWSPTHHTNKTHNIRSNQDPDPCLWNRIRETIQSVQEVAI